MSQLHKNSESTPWHQPGRWSVHPYNYSHLKEDSAPPERSVYVVDSTIRSICTSEPGSFISPEQIVEIVAELEAVGVKSVVFNVDHMGGRSELAEAAARLAFSAGFAKIKFEGGAVGILPYRSDREWKEKFHQDVEFGFDGLGITYGGGTPHIEGFHGTPLVFDQLHSIAEYMHSQGHPPSFSFNITPDKPISFFMEFVRHAARAKARYLRVYDTKATMSPHTVERLIGQIREEFSSSELPLVLHTHNGLGMAVASTCAAARAGVDGIDVAVNAVGTKSGHTDMIETAIALETLYGIRTGLDLTRLTGLCRLVERNLGINVHNNQPIVGRHAFLVEQSMQVVTALKERISGREHETPIAPSLVGGHRRIVWGKNTMKQDAVSVKLESMGIPATAENVSRSLSALKAELARRTKYPAWLEDDEADLVIRDSVVAVTP